MIMPLDPWGDLPRRRLEESRREAAHQRRVHRLRATSSKGSRRPSPSRWVTVSPLVLVVAAALALKGASVVALAVEGAPGRGLLGVGALLWATAAVAFVAWRRAPNVVAAVTTAVLLGGLAHPDVRGAFTTPHELLPFAAALLSAGLGLLAVAVASEEARRRRQPSHTWHAPTWLGPFVALVAGSLIGSLATAAVI